MKVKCVNLQGLGKFDGCTYISTTVSVAKVCYKSNQWSLCNQNLLRLHKWSNHLHKSDFKCNKLLKGNSNPSDHPSIESWAVHDSGLFLLLLSLQTTVGCLQPTPLLNIKKAVSLQESFSLFNEVGDYMLYASASRWLLRGRIRSLQLRTSKGLQ